MRLLIFLHGTAIMHAGLPADSSDLHARIESIVVPEFGGIDGLPDSLEELLTFGADRSASATRADAGRASSHAFYGERTLL